MSNLFSAVEANNASEVELLLEAGANPNIQNNKGNTALIYAVLNNENKDIVELLLKSGIKVNTSNKINYTALMYVIDLDIAEMLIWAGAEINVKNNKGNTALFFNVKRSNIKLVKTLLKYGAQPNSNCLQEAINRKNIPIIKLLLEYRFDISGVHSIDPEISRLLEN